mgnify:CR=1 FL=1
MAVIIPDLNTKVAFSMTLPLPIWAVTPVILTAVSCAPAGVCCAHIFEPAIERARAIKLFFKYFIRFIFSIKLI